MHMRLYFIGACTAVMGAFLGYMNGSIDIIATGLLAAVLFGALGKVVHLLERLDNHLGSLREERRTSPTRLALVPEEYLFSGQSGIRSAKGSAAPGSRERPH